MILNDGPHGHTLNGEGVPTTEPIAATLGQTIRIHILPHAASPHGMHGMVTAVAVE
jgi:hypothetical protein